LLCANLCEFVDVVIFAAHFLIVVVCHDYL
jgi:hypothetical protein